MTTSMHVELDLVDPLGRDATEWLVLIESLIEDGEVQVAALHVEETEWPT